MRVLWLKCQKCKPLICFSEIDQKKEPQGRDNLSRLTPKTSFRVLLWRYVGGRLCASVPERRRRMWYRCEILDSYQVVLTLSYSTRTWNMLNDGSIQSQEAE
eukprot:gene10784-22512_t